MSEEHFFPPEFVIAVAATVVGDAGQLSDAELLRLVWQGVRKHSGRSSVHASFDASDCRDSDSGKSSQSALKTYIFVKEMDYGTRPNKRDDCAEWQKKSRGKDSEE